MMLVNKKSAMKLRALYSEPGREPGFSPVLPACLCRFVGTLAVGAGEPTDRASPCMTWKAAAVTIGGTVIIVTFGALLMLTCDCAPKLCPDTDTVRVALSAPLLPLSPSCAGRILSTAAATCRRGSASTQALRVRGCSGNATCKLQAATTPGFVGVLFHRTPVRSGLAD